MQPTPKTIVKNVSARPKQYLDFVVFADGHGPHVVLLAELLGQGRRHDLPPDV